MNFAQIRPTDPAFGKCFKPERYWISASVQDELTKIRNMLLQISPGLFSTPDFGQERNIHVASIDEVVQYYGTNNYMVTPQYLEMLINKKINSFYLYPDARQRISLTFYNLHIAVTGVDSTEFLSLYSKIVLNAGIPVHPSNTEQMDIFVSTKMLDKYVLNAVDKGIPIVSPDFITVGYAKQKSQNIDDYRIRPFTGLTFCSSDLDDTGSKEAKKCVKEGKGVWSECLDQDVDFLIAERITETKKIRIAL